VLQFQVRSETRLVKQGQGIEMLYSLSKRIAFRFAMLLTLLMMALLLIGVSLTEGSQITKGALQATIEPNTTYYVTTVEDEPAVDRGGLCGNPCTLRGAVAASNYPPGGKIILPSGTYTLTYGSLVTERNIEVVGDGADVTVIHVEFKPFNIFSIRNTSKLTLSDVALTGGSAVNGGALENQGDLTLIHSVVAENEATVGGGIWNEGALTLMDSMVVHNSASENDGGITNLGTTSLIQSTVSDNNGEVGAGGIANFGTLNVYSSTIEYNRGGDGGGLKNLGDLFLDSSTVSGNEVFGNGGGLYNDAGDVKMINSTLSGNTADNGGGIYNQGASTIWITSATIANNSAASEGGGIFMGGGAGLVLRNTILSANAGENCHGIFGTVTNILVSSNDCNLTGTVIVADPQLGDLQDNGGPTETHALLDGSPALKAVPGEDCIDFSGQPLLTDQRGMPRIEGERCDIGAYELNYSRFLPLITR
jgi:hypothetical protein